MKEDISRKAVVGAAKSLQRAMELLKAEVPLGPTHVQMTPSEAVREYRDLDGDTLLRLRPQMGEEVFRQVLAEKAKKNGPTSTASGGLIE